MESIDLSLLRESLAGMLREDVGSGDITAAATIPVTARATGQYRTKQALVVAGVSVLREMVGFADPNLDFTSKCGDGDSVPEGTIIAEIRGSARSILTVERTSLNLLQRMCGIATL